MKILKYSVISDINKGDVFISTSINYIDKKIFNNDILNEDILFKKFDIDERLRNELTTTTFFKIYRRGFIMSYVVLGIKKIIFLLKHKQLMLDQISECDIVMIGGGNLLMESNGGDLFYRTMKIIELAKYLNKKVIIYAVGLGPFEFPYKNRLISMINSVDQFYVRDENNKQICEEFKNELNKEVGVVLDPAFIVSDIHKGHDCDIKYIGFNFMNYSKVIKDSKFDIEEVVKNIHKLHIEYKLPIKIINTSFGEDLSISRIIKEELNHLNVEVKIYNIKNLEDLPHAFCDLLFFVASRMHSSIFSMSYNVPTLIYPWHPKVKYLQKLLFNNQFELPLLHSENFNSTEISHKIKAFKKLNLPSVVDTHKENIYRDYENIFKSF